MTVTPGSSGGGGGGTGGGDFAGSLWPPGFRFHPTDEELAAYYLKKKICRKRHRFNVIRELDVYKYDPVDLPEQSLLKTGDRQWFFFTPRDRKYPNGARSNRGTGQGYWKVTGKDRTISCGSRAVGVKKTLVFYRGRAPMGERTDWVMHEYTLNEKELKRCPVVKDYYALYKLYKKSGLGPKNGAQYGAVFKEEDWLDDESVDVRDPINPDAHIERQIEVVNDESVGYFHQADPLFDDFDDILREFANGLEHELPEPTNQAPVQLQVGGEEVAESTLNDPSFGSAIFHHLSPITATPAQPYNTLAGYDFNQSGSSGWLFQETPEFTSAPFLLEQSAGLSGEDFLEIDDLKNHEPLPQDAGNPSKNLQLDGFDYLSEFDLYHDATMFLHDMGAVDQETIYQPYGGVVDQVDCMFEQQSYTGEGIANPGFVNDQGFDTVSSSDANCTTFPQTTSGFICESTTNNPNGLHQNQNNEESNGWLSSVLWSFVESIPTTPASASESPLVNKALERISSFSRVRVNVKNSDTAVISKSSSVTRTSTANANSRVLILLAIFGALCAVLWIFAGSLRFSWKSISL